MTDLTALLDRNQSFAEQFDAGDLAIRPRMSTIILTCLDARVESPGRPIFFAFFLTLAIPGSVYSRHTVASNSSLLPLSHKPQRNLFCSMR